MWPPPPHPLLKTTSWYTASYLEVHCQSHILWQTTNSLCLFLVLILWGLGRWLRSQEHLIFLQGTGDGFQKPFITLVVGASLTASYHFLGYQCIYTYVYMQAKQNIFKRISAFSPTPHNLVTTSQGPAISVCLPNLLFLCTIQQNKVASQQT